MYYWDNIYRKLMFIYMQIIACYTACVNKSASI